jgi:hypothetical protein
MMDAAPEWGTADTDPASLCREMQKLLATRPDPDERENVAYAYLRLLFGLGRASELAGELTPEVVTCLKATAPQLERVGAGFEDFLHESRDGLLQEFLFHDQWPRALERRSAVQFLIDLYRGLAPPGVLEQLDTEEVDWLLRRTGETEGFLSLDEIPDGIPASHWWWHLPG